MNLFAIIVQEVPLSAILDLRTQVLRPHLTPPQKAHFDGDLAPTTHHFAAFYRDRPHQALATVSYFDSPYPEDHHPAVQLRGMAVTPALRRQGLGSHLLQTTLSRLPLLYPTHRLLWCNAREQAIPFYQAQGFQIASPTFELPHTGPHRRMTRHIPPALATP